MSVSIRDVAQRAGVSVGTVSNVLNRPSKVSRDALQRVQQAIDELGFVRNDAARQLRVGQSRTIGLIVLDVGNPFFTDLARGAEAAAAEGGYSVLLGNSDENGERELGYLSLFEEQRVRGVLISPRDDVGERLAVLRSRGIESVLVDRRDERGEYPSVSVDDVAGGRMAVEHLLATGRRRIAFVGGPHSIRQVQERLSGASQAVAEHPGAAIEIVTTDALTVLQGRAAGERILARPPGERPDAIFAANDLIAMGVMQALVMRGSLRVPEDIALIGYDDIDFAAAAVVPLSSIRQPSELMGRTAVELLIAATESEARRPFEPVVFQPELVVRETTVKGAGS